MHFILKINEFYIVCKIKFSSTVEHCFLSIKCMTNSNNGKLENSKKQHRWFKGKINFHNNFLQSLNCAKFE